MCEALRSNSNGQKLEAAIPAINARHATKQLGLKKGAVAYALLVEGVCGAQSRQRILSAVWARNPTTGKAAREESR